MERVQDIDDLRERAQAIRDEAAKLRDTLEELDKEYNRIQRKLARQIKSDMDEDNTEDEL